MARTGVIALALTGIGALAGLAFAMSRKVSAPVAYVLEFQRGDGSWLFGSVHDSEIAAHTREKRWRDYIRNPVVPTLAIKATRVRAVPKATLRDAFGVFIVDAKPLPAEAIVTIHKAQAAAQADAARLGAPLYGRYEVKPVRVPADQMPGA